MNFFPDPHQQRSFLPIFVPSGAWLAVWSKGTDAIEVLAGVWFSEGAYWLNGDDVVTDSLAGALNCIGAVCVVVVVCTDGDTLKSVYTT